jgi:predicted TIM-barrel fold metal-dependent hydrolase
MADSRLPVPQPDIPAPVASPSRPAHTLPPGSCDSHAHIFGPASQYPYAPGRGYTPHDASLDDYARLLHHLGFSRAVLVQPSVYGTDNRLMCDALARAQDGDALGIQWRGIVVIDDTVTDAELERLNGLGVRGVRLNLLFEGADVGFEQVRRLADRIAPLGWHLQFLIDITTFENFATRLAALPVDSVIDHIGHFPAGKGPKTPAFQDLKGLLADRRAWVKLSGPNRISSSDQAPFTDAHALAHDLVMHAPDRLVFGTDWPHVKLPGSMPDDGVLVNELYRWADNDMAVIRKVLVDNPQVLYGF